MAAVEGPGVRITGGSGGTGFGITRGATAGSASRQRRPGCAGGAAASARLATGPVVAAGPPGAAGPAGPARGRPRPACEAGPLARAGRPGPATRPSPRPADDGSREPLSPQPDGRTAG